MIGKNCVTLYTSKYGQYHPKSNNKKIQQTPNQSYFSKEERANGH